MTARCTFCNSYVHFGGRGSKLADLCHSGKCELMTYDYQLNLYRNKAGDKFLLDNGKFKQLNQLTNHIISH